MIEFVYNDGGRRDALLKTNDSRYSGNVRDCVARALAIMTERPYTEVWERLAAINQSEGRRHSANNGVFVGRQGFREYAESLGLVYVSLRDANGFHPMLKDLTLPSGRIVLNVRQHSVAMIDGVLHDTHHCSPHGRVLVRGYWMARPVMHTMYNVCNGAGRPLNRAPLNYPQAETMARLLLLNYKTETKITPI